MHLNEGMALSLALAESEIKRKQTESLLAEMRQAYEELIKKVEALEKASKEPKKPRQKAEKAVN